MFIVSNETTINLLPATTAGANFIVGVTKSDQLSTCVNLIPSSTTIEGYSNYVLTSANDSVFLISDGNDWRIMNSRTPFIASVYSVPGTYYFTIPNPVTSIYACVFGAGGGGGNGGGNSGNGGGGGGYTEWLISKYYGI